MAFLFLYDMGKITAVTRQKRNPNRLNIYVDGEFAFGLADMVGATLRIGQELAQSEIDQLQDQDLLEKARQSALNFLSYRPRSIAEVRRNLIKKEFAELVVEQVIGRLQELELLNDKTFAQYWVEQREAFKPRSAIALRSELYQKGVANDIIEEVLLDLDETAAARKAAETKAPRWQHLDREQFQKKLGGFLQRRGFHYGIVRQIIDEMWEENV